MVVCSPLQKSMKGVRYERNWTAALTQLRSTSMISITDIALGDMFHSFFLLWHYPPSFAFVSLCYG